MSTLLIPAIVLAIVVVSAWLVVSPLNDATRDHGSHRRDPDPVRPDPDLAADPLPRGGDGYPTVLGRIRAVLALVGVSVLGGAATAVVLAAVVFVVIQAASSSFT